MKVIWYSHSNESSGAERVMVETMVMLHSAGVEVEAIIPNVGAVHSIWKGLPFPVTLSTYASWSTRPGHATSRFKFSALYRHALSIPSLVFLFARRKPDLVFTNTITIPSAAIAAKILGAKHVWFVHEMDLGAHAIQYLIGRRWSLKLVSWLSRLIIVASTVVRNHYADVLPASKLRVLNYAVEPTIDFPVRSTLALNEPLRLTILGALTPGKRQEDAIKAVSILKRRGVEVWLSIVGGTKNDYALYLRKLVAELGVDERINFIGESPRPLDYLANSDAALICSKDEAFGRVTVEAMKVGVPVIGARSGGTVELIFDGETGLLYEAGNPFGLADCIAQLANDRSLISKMGDAGRKSAMTRFNGQRCERELLALINEAQVVR